MSDMPAAPDTFAARLRAAREEAGLTMYEAARQAGISYATWHGWESGKAAPKVDRLPAIVTALSHKRQPALRLLGLLCGVE